VGNAGPAGTVLKDRDVERDVYFPLPLALSGFPRLVDSTDSFSDPTYHRIRQLIVQVDSTDHVLTAKKLVERILRRRHGQSDDFEIVAPLEVLEQSRRTQEIFNLVMVLIAGLSLVVGGIGIMNIMLVSVRERTREIGLRRAVGATQPDILAQFLMEAIVISVAGGLMGIVVGMAISACVGALLGWPTVTTVASILMAFGVSAGVGVLFGLFPARTAAELDPIEALRHE
jgi:putative ABC transport system permease protein